MVCKVRCVKTCHLVCMRGKGILRHWRRACRPVGPSPFCFSFWSFLLLFSAEHMLTRDISACRICLFRVDLLPLMLAKMCQLCLFLFLPARFLLDFCSFARFLLAVCSTSALQRSWPWCVVWHSVHNFTVSCVWCLGAVLYIFVLVRYSYYSSSMYDNGNIQHTSHEAYMYFRSFLKWSNRTTTAVPPSENGR